MSNINPGQFFNNFSNNFNGINTNNIQNTPLNQNQMPQVQQNTPLDVLLPNYIQQLQQTTSQLASLNQQQLTNMIKDLLNFSKNFDSFLSQLTVNSQNINHQTALLMLASTLNLTQLSSLLQSNSKDAMTNLYQMLAQYNQIGVSIKDEQLSELSKLILFVAASATSDVQSLKTTMLMYLPWLPLTDPNAFKLEIANAGSDNNDISDDFVTVLIATENFGNLQANIYKTQQDGIRIELITSETFPQNDFVILMKEESKKYSININFQLEKKEIFNKSKNENTKTQVSMNTSPGVNPFLLLISNALIKNVHIIDDKENLKEKRKEKINNGKSEN